MTRLKWIAWPLLLCTLLGALTPIWGQTNETVTVQAKAKDNPQGNTQDVEGHFSETPSADKDEIHITNENVKGDTAGVYNDPVNDGALLTFAQESGPVKVDVEGREGIGAIYYVTVIPGGSGGGSGSGGSSSDLWADVEDVKQPGALILRDIINGLAESDLTDSDDSTPVLSCWADNGKGEVEFWLIVESDTYNWSITQSAATVASGTLNSSNAWKALQGELDPNLYTLEITKSGDSGFKRRIDFIVIKATFTIFIDQPGAGGDRDIIEDPVMNPDVGHTFWQIDVVPSEAVQLLDTDLQPYVGARRGFYPANAVGPSNPTSPGIVRGSKRGLTPFRYPSTCITGKPTPGSCRAGWP